MEKNKKEGHKISLGKDGIIYVEMFGDLDRDNALAAINETVNIAKNNPHKAKILAVLNASSSFGNSSWRKELVEKLKALYKNPGFKKVAVYGMNLTVRTIVYFVLGATQIKNIKLFPNKESAIKWLNT